MVLQRQFAVRPFNLCRRRGVRHPQLVVVVDLCCPPCRSPLLSAVGPPLLAGSPRIVLLLGSPLDRFLAGSPARALLGRTLPSGGFLEVVRPDSHDLALVGGDCPPPSVVDRAGDGGELPVQSCRVQASENHPRAVAQLVLCRLRTRLLLLRCRAHVHCRDIVQNILVCAPTQCQRKVQIDQRVCVLPTRGVQTGPLPRRFDEPRVLPEGDTAELDRFLRTHYFARIHQVEQHLQSVTAYERIHLGTATAPQHSKGGCKRRVQKAGAKGEIFWEEGSVPRCYQWQRRTWLCRN